MLEDEGNNQDTAANWFRGGEDEPVTIINAKPRPDFVKTPFISEIVDRAMSYIQAGYPVHFRGPAGTGKTTLAMHLASLIERPIMLIFGDDEFGSSDLIGSQAGYRRTKVIDNFIHSVLKTEDNMRQQWVDNRLTIACGEGLTLIYDEFTRSRPEANNVLLSILEEKLIAMPALRGGEGYLKVHPDFRAIFTSNPEEYAGVHKVQDALQDRMVTIDLQRLDEETEVEIAKTKANITHENALRITRVVRDFREIGELSILPTIRSVIMIARVLKLRGGSAYVNNQSFVKVCQDVLLPGAIRSEKENTLSKAKVETLLMDLIEKHCSKEAPQEKKTKGIKKTKEEMLTNV